MIEEQLKLYRETLPGATDEQLEVRESIAVTIGDAARQIAEALTRVAKALAPAMKALARCLSYKTALDKCPNRRVAYLAQHARKARTRKKNLHRALKIIKKEGTA